MGRDKADQQGKAPSFSKRLPSKIIASYFLTSKGVTDQSDGKLPPVTAEVADQEDGEEELDLGAIIRKVSRVLMPICFLAGVLNYLDRTNLNFAALQLNAELGFTPQDYGLGAGFFSLGEAPAAAAATAAAGAAAAVAAVAAAALCMRAMHSSADAVGPMQQLLFARYGIGHVPSTFVTMRCGARWWYSSITIAWGVVATCAALIHNRTGLFLQRFFLGITEAGAIPSALHLMSQFYPVQMRTKPFTAVTLANVVSVVFAAPLAAGLMALHGRGGLKGWQWLFIIEGIPSVILGVAMMVFVPSHPLSAWMLTPRERKHLHLTVHQGNRVEAAAATKQLQWKQMITLSVEVLKMPLMWYFSIAAFLWVLCVFSLNSWMAIIIKNMLAGTALQGSTSSGGNSAVNTLHATLLSAIPYFCAAISMWSTAWSSERHKERTLHVGLPCVVGGIVLAFFKELYVANFVAGFAAIVIAMACAYSGQSVMFAKITELLDTQHAGVGLAIFNAVGAAIGGFSGPWTVGAIVGQVGSFVPAMVYMGMFLLAAGLMLTGWGIYEQVCKRRRARLALPAEDEVVNDVAGSLTGSLTGQQQQLELTGKDAGATLLLPASVGAKNE
uniref:Major facilitator superfamily (MFS) profile domain-containing protein n=1 Tax=Tetradesmus obliquus TaxID=3088 RepID=A0A383W9P8_TETOB|eukprot:jgi/Sobl393_1/3548/SZX74368.1